jgi:hypothetical protein
MDTTNIILPMAEAMSYHRRTLYSRAASASGQRHFGLGLWIFLLAAAIGETSAGAQTSGSGAQNPPSASNESNSPSAGGGVGTTSAFPGAALETLPPAPVGGFGLASPTAPPYSLNTEIPTQILPPTLSLLPPHAGIVPLQQYDPNAPAVLIQPTASLSEIFIDNVNYVHSPRKFAAITQLAAGSSVSVDTPRLQAVATGQVNGNIYLPGSNSSLNQVFGSLYASGTATIYPDLFFIDLQSSISQSTTAPGFGFQNLSTLPRNQQTQQYFNNISPYLRKSFDGLVDTELRYTFGYTNYGGNTTIVTTPVIPGQTSLASSALNEGTFIAATGENFEPRRSALTAILNIGLLRQSPRSRGPAIRTCDTRCRRRRVFPEPLG